MEGAVVHVATDRVSIQVVVGIIGAGVARVPQPIAVIVFLQRVGVIGADVSLIIHVVTVPVVVAVVTHTVPIEIRLDGIVEIRTIVLAQRDSVAVRVRFADAAQVLGVPGLAEAGDIQAVAVVAARAAVTAAAVVSTLLATAIGYAAGKLVADLAAPTLTAGVPAAVLSANLARTTGNGQVLRFAVIVVLYFIAVNVSVAGIALSIQVHVLLLRVGIVGTVVLYVRDPVLVGVCLAVNAHEREAGIAHALVRIADGILAAKSALAAAGIVAALFVRALRCTACEIEADIGTAIPALTVTAVVAALFAHAVDVNPVARN